MATFERLDREQYDRQVAFLQHSQTFTEIINSFISQAENNENIILQAVEKRFNAAAAAEENEEKGEEEEETEEGEEGEKKASKPTETKSEHKEPEAELLPPETEEPHELLQPFRAAQEVERVWKQKLVSDDMYSMILKLKEVELQPPALVLTLMELLARFLNIPASYYKDVFNNTSWEIIKEV